MKPIAELGDAMRRVDHGDLSAYVSYEGNQSETDMMLRRYNRMLQNININIRKQVQFERVKRDLDIQVLTNQINPHFLYNTLETIVWKACESDRPDIGKIASSLGKLYRLTVKGDGTWTTLSNEASHVQSYIDIQASRYEGLFLYECRMDESLSDFQVPKLILQPLVENIFLHVIEKRSKCISIRINIRRKKDGTVEVKVIDNGSGIENSRLFRIRENMSDSLGRIQKRKDGKRTQSICLSNVAARLHLYMDGQEPLQIYSKKNFGTKVLLLRKDEKDNFKS